MAHHLQPLLHDRSVTLTAPTQVWGEVDGGLDAGIHPIDGYYHCDNRVINRLRLTVGGQTPEPIGGGQPKAGHSEFYALTRGIDDHTADPRVRLTQRRDVRAGHIQETVTISNGLATEISTDVCIELNARFDSMQDIKAGIPGNTPLRIVQAGDQLTLTAAHTTCTLHAPGADISVSGERIALRWQVSVAARGEASIHLAVELRDDAAVVRAAAPEPAWDALTVEATDPRLAAWLDRALSDLQALRMCTTRNPNEPFLAAGAPWFFTLFGRDSIWAARLLLPLGTALAASTLRALAGFQGSTTNADTAEQPGKIMHELRAQTLHIPGEQVSLPPLYYGTVDATALWICLLHDAHRWGMPDDEVRALLPNLEAALGWLREHADSDGDGFIEYRDESGHGLANQGWKDSGDSIQFRDGSLAEGPIALCEVQAYAYEAAMGAAVLLERFGRPGAASWRLWAADLKARFGAAFWVDDDRGGYPAIALDAHKRAVDSVSSNLGHLLGSGILTREQSVAVAARLVSPELSSGFGVRTLAATEGGFWPLSYHGGTVWAHDTAIAIRGLVAEGFTAEAAVLAEGLLAAAAGFNYRMPELHSGESRVPGCGPVPYPAACRPQAWSSAAAVSVLSARLGLCLDLVADDLSITPDTSAGALSVAGLSFRGAPVWVRVSADGVVSRG